MARLSQRSLVAEFQKVRDCLQEHARKLALENWVLAKVQDTTIHPGELQGSSSELAHTQKALLLAVQKQSGPEKITVNCKSIKKSKICQ